MFSILLGQGALAQSLDPDVVVSIRSPQYTDTAHHCVLYHSSHCSKVPRTTPRQTPLTLVCALQNMGHGRGGLLVAGRFAGRFGRHLSNRPHGKIRVFGGVLEGMGIGTCRATRLVRLRRAFDGSTTRICAPFFRGQLPCRPSD